MVALIKTGGALGNRRCDARCYNGKATTKCKCCCGGVNHAKGLATAAEQTALMSKRKLENMADGGDKTARNILDVVFPQTQIDLFSATSPEIEVQDV